MSLRDRDFNLYLNWRDFNLYLNWLMYAVVGKMGEADGIAEEGGDSIRAVAAHLRRAHPIPDVLSVHRGLLIEPSAVPEDRVLQPIPEQTFHSWSEDPDVARWFADVGSRISSYVLGLRPQVRGWVASAAVPSSDALWHWSWADLFVLPGLPWRPLVAYAAVHPDIRDHAGQLQWNLITQREVITVPRAVRVEPYYAGFPEEARALDERLCHPAFRHPAFRHPAFRHPALRLEILSARKDGREAGAR